MTVARSCTTSTRFTGSLLAKRFLEYRKERVN
jgi:hypothetical protein